MLREIEIFRSGNTNGGHPVYSGKRNQSTLREKPAALEIRNRYGEGKRGDAGSVSQRD